MNKTIEFTQEELIALEELVKDAAKESELVIWQTLREKVYKTAYNK